MNLLALYTDKIKLANFAFECLQHKHVCTKNKYEKSLGHVHDNKLSSYHRYSIKVTSILLNLVDKTVFNTALNYVIFKV